MEIAPSNVVLLRSGDQVTAALKKANHDKLRAIFYFTAAWCGPCTAIVPVIEELSHKFPNVTTYKIDVDQEGLGSLLGNLRIYSVPTFHIFHNGEKATEIVGADVERLDTMENLYKVSREKYCLNHHQIRT
uniref:Thioredoxin domain-containing protein n=1 Tax=Musa acuminata subsp. malaccensis TaxID=214687 RepID=A0A804IFY8_MUSAM